MQNGLSAVIKAKGKRGREMTQILCWRDDCKFLQDSSVCGCAQISIDEDGECECFTDYRETEEWQNIFWKRMLDPKLKKECRVKARGKKLEMCGRVFFIEDRGYYANITDEETGLSCGSVAQLNENVDVIGKIKEKAKEYTSVLTLPIAIYNRAKRTFSYPNEESEDGE